MSLYDNSFSFTSNAHLFANDKFLNDRRQQLVAARPTAVRLRLEIKLDLILSIIYTIFFL